MSWAKLDDRFHSDPTIDEIGLPAVGLYAKALSYSACHELDGRVPELWVRKQGAAKCVQALLTHDLWRRENGSYWIKDFLKFNPSKAQLEERRTKDALRKQEARK